MSDHTPRGARWEKLAAAVKAQEPYCALCWELINPALKWPHPMSFACDHKLSPKHHPELAYSRDNVQASHMKCNRAKGEPGRKPKPRKTSQHYRVDDI